MIQRFERQVTVVDGAADGREREREMTIRYFLILILFIQSGAKVWSQSFADLEKKFSDAVAADDMAAVIRQGPPYLKKLILEGDSAKASAVCNKISSAAYFTGDFRKSILFSMTGIRMLPVGEDEVRFKHASTIAEAYNGLAIADSAAWWFTECGNQLTRHPQLESELTPYVTAFYNNIGAFYLRKRDIYSADLYLRKAMLLAKKMKDQRAVGIAVNSLGNLYNQSGEYAKAETYYLSALHYFPSRSIDRCWIYHSLGSNANLAKRHSEGLAYLRKGLSLYRSLPQDDAGNKHPQLEKWLMIQLGKGYSGERNFGEAKNIYSHLLSQFAELQDQHSEELSATLVGAGHVSAAEGRFQSALQFYQRAVISSSKSFMDTSVMQNPGSAQILSGRWLFDALMAKAACFEKIYEKSGRVQALVQAGNTYTAALAVARRMRKEMNGMESKIFFSRTARPAFEKAIDLAYRLYHDFHRKEWLVKLVELQENSRNMVFSDALHESLIKPESLGKEVLEKDRQMNQDIIHVKKELATTLTPAGRKQREMTLDDLLRKKQAILEGIDKVNPEYRRMKYEDVSFDMAQIKRNLDNRTAYLAYYVSSDFLYATLVLRGQVQVARTKIDQRLEKNIKALRTSAQTNPEMFDFQANAESAWLYHLLIAPFKAEVAGRCDRLIIARDGELNTIPFEVLTQNDRYLFEDFAISYAYSAATIGSGIPKRGYSTNTIGFAPFVASDKTLLKDRGFKVLENSEHEINETSDFRFAGSEASRSAFLKVIPQAGILHLATHASYNDSVPENSHISFFPVQQYQLPVYEIMNLPLSHVRLAILSVCDGDKTKSYHGEGLISLSRAFGLAGCPAIVTSMWAANDAATDFIVTAFYKHLRNGKPGDYALQAAKKDFLKSPLAKIWNHPYYWAHITYIGDSSPVFPKPFHMSAGWAIFVLMVFILTSVALCRRFLLRKL